MYVLFIENDRVQVHRDDTSLYMVKSVDDFDNYMQQEASRLGVKREDLEVAFSSTIDFPEEFTTNADTIAHALRQAEQPRTVTPP